MTIEVMPCITERPNRIKGVFLFVLIQSTNLFSIPGEPLSQAEVEEREQKKRKRQKVTRNLTIEQQRIESSGASDNQQPKRFSVDYLLVRKMHLDMRITQKLKHDACPNNGHLSTKSEVHVKSEQM